MKVNKLRVFWSYDMRTQLMFIEAFILLGWARILKGISFSKLAPMLGTPMKETSYTVPDSNKRLLSQIQRAVYIMSRYTFWESKCLVQAIAAMKMLERRHIESTMYLGTAKDGKGKLLAHAWLRCGPYFLTGGEEMERFTVTGKFAKEIRK